MARVTSSARRLGRYAVHMELASGGMATVHLGRVIEGEGAGRVVAVKRLHKHVAEAPGARAMLIDEARLGARLRHPNVVATLDVVDEDGELALVMEYVHGVSLAFVTSLAEERNERVPHDVASSIVLDVLAGLEAAHTATDDAGRPLEIVHRDVSPHNVLVAEDGAARLLDFGVAKAQDRVATTRDGHLKGKLRYMAPEHVLEEETSPRADLYAAGVVLWELLVGARLFDGSNEAAIFARVLEGVVLAPSKLAADLSPAVDDLVLKSLSRDAAARFPDARAMADALRLAIPPATRAAVGAFVRNVAGAELDARAELVRRVEAGSQSVSARSIRTHPAHGDEGTLTTTSARPALTVSPPLPSTTPRSTSTAPASPAVSPAPASSKRRTMVVALAIMTLATVSTAAYLGATRARHDRGSEVAGAPASIPSLSVRSGIPAATASAITFDASLSNGAASVPAVTAPIASGSAAVAPVAPSRTTLAGAPPRRGKLRTPTAPSSARRPGCDPMFTIDENGIRRVKPECL